MKKIFWKSALKRVRGYRHGFFSVLYSGMTAKETRKTVSVLSACLELGLIKKVDKGVFGALSVPFETFKVI